jgi:cytochrome c peroxidase
MRFEMKKRSVYVTAFALLLPALAYSGEVVKDTDGQEITLEAGHPSLAKWILPDIVPEPADNPTTAEKVTLGKHLYFDPRLSRNGTVSCATCHNPSLGWADGVGVAVGVNGLLGKRSSPTIINTGYNTIHMWDGRKKSLEDQASGPMEASNEMASDFEAVYKFLNNNRKYKAMFEAAFPGSPIDKDTMAKALASFERTVVSNNSRFDRWIKGDATALKPQEINGFRLFIDPNKGNCSVCHSGANFTDNGFHNLGLKQFGGSEPDVGRYHLKKVKTMNGAFKTPTIREITQTAPYMHDGSIRNLRGVVEHYVKGGEVRENLSPNMKPLDITKQEQDDLIAFMRALTSPYKPVSFPNLPK